MLSVISIYMLCSLLQLCVVVYTKSQVLYFTNPITTLCSTPMTAKNTRPCFHIGTFWEQDYIVASSLQHTVSSFICYMWHNCEQNDLHPQLSTFNNLLEWATSLKWCSSFPSSPVHSHPSSLCVHNTCSWLRDRLRLLLG